MKDMTTQFLQLIGSRRLNEPPLPRVLETQDGFILMTPELADWILTYRGGKNPRRFHKNTARLRADDLTHNNWHHKVSDPMGFDTEGNLVQGQHRCFACRLTGVSFLTRINFLLTPNEVKAMDNVKVRRGYENLGISSKHESILNSIRKYSTGSKADKRKLSTRELEEFNKEYKESIKFWDSLRPKVSFNQATEASVIVRAHHAGEDPDKLEKFVAAMRGQAPEIDRPQAKVIGKLSALMQKLKAGSEAERLSRVRKVEKALLYFLANEELKSLRENAEPLWPRKL